MANNATNGEYVFGPVFERTDSSLNVYCNLWPWCHIVANEQCGDVMMFNVMLWLALLFRWSVSVQLPLLWVVPQNNLSC